MRRKTFYGSSKANIKDKYGLTPRDYYKLLSGGVWCAETCAPRMRKDWTPGNKTLGQCSVTAFLMQDLFGGNVLGVPLEGGGFHCFNDVSGCVFDLTNEQFGDRLPDYKAAVEQSREVHFAKEEKYQRYLLLKDKLFEKLPRIIETPRLVLRPFTHNDAADVEDYLGNIDVNCFLSMKISGRKEALKAARRRASSRDYYFAIADRETGKVAGEIFGEPEAEDPEMKTPDTVSVCWMLGKGFRGKGYAYEAARAYIDYLFNEKGMRRVYAYTEDTNVSSRKLCERLGMRQEGLFREFVTFVNDAEGEPVYENTCQYAILKKEWNSKKI